MLRALLASKVASAVSRLIASGTLPPSVGEVPVEISDTKDPAHGDYACNLALAASKAAGMNPRQIAEQLRGALASEAEFEGVEVAGPGFINFRLKPKTVAAFVATVIESGVDLRKPQSASAEAQRINVEFVSVNPNGPITVGSGRGAAFGDTLCRVLEAAGNTVNREYYINDGVNSEQMRLFAESVRSYVESSPFPEGGYKGDYVRSVADALITEVGALQTLSEYQSRSQASMLASQRESLAAFGVEFDTWFSEQSLHDSGVVAKCLDALIAKGAADEEPRRTKLKMGKGGVIEDVLVEAQAAEVEEDDVHGDTPNSSHSPSAGAQGEGNTLWLRSTKFGDDMDRVLRRRDGRLTYIASDVAYHADKFNRPPNADKLITILGPDHHGYIGRLHAVLAALELEPLPLAAKPEGEGVGDGGLDDLERKLYRSKEERDACKRALSKARRELEVVIFQIVRFMKDGKPAPMRKRDGNIYELRDLIAELGKAQAPGASEDEQLRIGRDVARFFYLMRSHDTHMDFDIDLATKQSDENPVFYVQYAHARICSVIRKAEESGLRLPNRGDYATLLSHPRELALVKKILDLPEEVSRCAKDFGVHRLTTYAVELARTYHHFYDACRVVQPDQRTLSEARLALCEASRIALAATLDLLGVSAPERMERSDPSPSAA